MALDRAVYRPRDAEHTVLHAVIREHREPFRRAVSDQGDGGGLPEFVTREFREFLTGGVLAHGVARLRSEACALERFVPFSCKGRGVCPSCGGRRMTERAAHWVDEVLPWVPVRQWVLTIRTPSEQSWNLSGCPPRCPRPIRPTRPPWRRQASPPLFPRHATLSRLGGAAVRPDPPQRSPTGALDSAVLRAVSRSNRRSKMMRAAAPSAPSRPERQTIATASKGLYVS